MCEALETSCLGTVVLSILEDAAAGVSAVHLDELVGLVSTCVAEEAVMPILG